MSTMSMSAMEIQQIPIITVSYNAPDLIADLLKSLRRFYSNKVYIIDGSEAGRAPAIAAVAAGYADVDFIHFDYNIHHGPGMAWALTQLDLAGPVLVIDSDVEVLHAGFLESLAAELTPQMYGVGQLNYVNRGGFDVAGYDQPKPPDTVTYLHPALMLCNIAVVRQWPMPVKHGAPMIPTMTAIHDAGRTDLLHHVEWVRADFAVPSAHRYIRHDWQGTVGRTGGYHLEEWQAQVIAEHQQALAARTDAAPASAAAPTVASADLSTVLLSICIPTFNRAPFLAQTLASITAQAAFTGSSNVEVVVSDNWSSDDTAAVVARFVEAFPGKVRYTRPAQAVPADVNFGLVLEHGQGTFLKLHNDNLMIRDGSLAEILKVIQATSAEQPVLFFTNGNQHAGQPIEVAANLSDFVRRASYFSTWIGGFGIWRSQFAAMPDFARHADLQLVQTDVLLRLVGAGKRAIILFDAYFAGLDTGKKGGYNIAKVFGHNYLSLLKPYVAAGLLDDTVYQEEKKRILLKHIIPFYFDAGNGFLKDGFFEHMQDYLHEPYFHAAMEQLLGKAQQAAPAVPVAPPTQKELLRAYWDQVKAQWRADNAHNETSLQRIHGRLQPGQISVGRKSYGPLTVWIYGGADEALRIGNFVSIADGVTFLLGGDHGYGALSTFPFRAKYFGSPDAQGKGPVTVDDDVWIGYNSTILSGVHIGQGAVIAAGSMVTKDVAPYSVVGGNPAKLIKYRFAPEVITALLGFDFSTLSDAAILRSRELLYTALTAENVHAVLAQLRAAGAGLN